VKEFRLGDPFPPTPEGFHLRVISALDGLKEEPMIRRHKIGRLVLVAALVLILLIGTALAAGYFSGEIDWTGRRVAEDSPDEPEITEAPAGAADAQARTARGEEIFAAQPEDEYWIIENGDGTATARDCEKTFDSLDALNEFLKSGATNFRLVTEAPEGYAFEEAYCTFYFTREIVEGAAVTEEDVGDGMTLTRIKPGDGYLSLVCSYSVTFRNAAKGDYLNVYADYASPDLKDSSFGVDEDDVYESVDIDGMEHALYFDRGEDRELVMVEKAGEVAGYTALFELSSILDGSEEAETFGSLTYEITCLSLGRDALIGFAESLK